MGKGEKQNSDKTYIYYYEYVLKLHAEYTNF